MWFIYRYPGTTTRVLNMGSYNYLGFAENHGPIASSVENTIYKYSVGQCSTRHEIGNSIVNDTLLSEKFKFNSENILLMNYRNI